MSIVAWILLGLLSGYIATRIVGSNEGILLSMVLGVAGAVVGGGIFQWAGQSGVTGFNLWSVFVAVIGSITVLSIYFALAGRRR